MVTNGHKWSDASVRDSTRLEEAFVNQSLLASVRDCERLSDELSADQWPPVLPYGQQWQLVGDLGEEAVIPMAVDADEQSLIGYDCPVVCESF